VFFVVIQKLRTREGLQIGRVRQFRSESGQVRAFAEIAVSQVAVVVAAIVLDRNDMFDMQFRKWRILLAKLTILATVFGPCPHKIASAFIHVMCRSLIPDQLFAEARR